MSIWRGEVEMYLLSWLSMMAFCGSNLRSQMLVLQEENGRWYLVKFVETVLDYDQGPGSIYSTLLLLWGDYSKETPKINSASFWKRWKIDFLQRHRELVLNDVHDMAATIVIRKQTPMSKLLMILQVHLMSSTCYFILTRWLLEYNISSFDTWKFLLEWAMKVWLGHQWKMKWMSLLWTWLIDQISNFYKIVFLLSKNKSHLVVWSALSSLKQKEKD